MAQSEITFARKFTIIAHLTQRVVCEDVSAVAVTVYLANRQDASRYTVMDATVDNFSDVEPVSITGDVWLAGIEKATVSAA
jgi:hypothetical protein